MANLLWSFKSYNFIIVNFDDGRDIFVHIVKLIYLEPNITCHYFHISFWIVHLGVCHISILLFSA